MLITVHADRALLAMCSVPAGVSGQQNSLLQTVGLSNALQLELGILNAVLFLCVMNHGLQLEQVLCLIAAYVKLQKVV